MKGGIKI